MDKKYYVQMQVFEKTVEQVQGVSDLKTLNYSTWKLHKLLYIKPMKYYLELHWCTPLSGTHNSKIRKKEKKRWLEIKLHD